MAKLNLMVPDVTIEECAEVIQAITKIKRFGFGNSGYDNRGSLETEIGQLLYMVDHITIEWGLSTAEINKAYHAKGAALHHYAQFNTCNQPEPKAK